MNTVLPAADPSPLPAPLPWLAAWLQLGDWQDSSQELRAGLFMQELRPDGTPVRAASAY